MSNLELRHPEEGLLLRYLDGELPGGKVRQIRGHLEACWQCRAQLEEIQAVVGECVRYRNNVLAPCLPPPPEPWRSLSFGLVDAELATESFFTRFARFLSFRQSPGLGWAVSAAVAVALCYVAVRQLRETPRVEAAVLLRKAEAAAQARPAGVKRLSIKTRTGQITRVAGVAYKPSPREAEIARLFDAAHYDWTDPLSARSYSSWREKLPHFQDAVASQPNSYDITTTTQDSELVSATLTLRTTDMQPVEGRFEFRNSDWVEMTELVDQQTNPASNVAGTTGGTPRQPGMPPGTLAVPVETTADSTVYSEELQVVAALHRLGADLGDPLEISRQGRQVLVSGTGIPPQRQQQIHGVLDRLPHVVVRFHDPAFPASATPAQSEPAARDAAGPDKATYPARIEERLGGRPQFERFSSSVLEWTDSAMTRAYALRRLAQQFPAAAESEMSAEDRLTLRRLAREHLAAFVKDLQRVDKTVTPVLTGMGNYAEIEARSESVSWQSATEDLLTSARRAETLLAVVLGVTPAENAAAGAPAQLLIALDQLSLRGGECQRLLADR